LGLTKFLAEFTVIIIGKKRCENLQEIDHALRITKNTKREHINKESFNSSHKQLTIPKVPNLAEIKLSIYFSNKTLDFYNCIVLFHSKFNMKIFFNFIRSLVDKDVHW
jgi:hypothetical protein